MDRLQHLGDKAHLGRRNERPDVAVKVDDAALVRRFRIKLGDRFDQAQAAVAHHQLYAFEPTAFKVPQEGLPGGFVFLGALTHRKDLTEPVLVYADGHQHADVLDLAAPGTL